MYIEGSNEFHQPVISEAPVPQEGREEADAKWEAYLAAMTPEERAHYNDVMAKLEAKWVTLPAAAHAIELMSAEALAEQKDEELRQLEAELERMKKQAFADWIAKHSGGV